jgi:hypothetical protein
MGEGFYRFSGFDRFSGCLFEGAHGSTGSSSHLASAGVNV